MTERNEDFLARYRGDSFELEIEESPSYLCGDDSEAPLLDLRFRITDDDGGAVDFVVLECEAPELLATIKVAIELAAQHQKELDDEQAEREAEADSWLDEIDDENAYDESEHDQ